MPESISATELRRNVYRILDDVLESGETRYISRRGKTLMLVSASPPRRRFGDGPKRRATDLTIDELAAISWEDAWDPEDAT